MLKPIISIALSLALAACTTGPGDAWRPSAAANPSAVIATELAFARAAREKGQWTAFREYATRDALWPVPQFASLQDTLRGEVDPPRPIVWQPDAVWSSCDGSYAVSTGPAEYPSGLKTRFVTVWQRQEDGRYRWVLDQSFDLEEGYAAPEMIAARVADCSTPGPELRRRGRFERPARGLDWRSGASTDGTLEWTTGLAPDCTRTLTLRTLEDGTMREVFRRVSAPPQTAEGKPAPSCPS
jgi:hypothetical protein